MVQCAVPGSRLRMSTHRARKRIREGKRKARPELATSDMWTAKDYFHSFDTSYEKVNDTLERINQDLVSEEEFIRRYCRYIHIYIFHHPYFLTFRK